MASLTVGLTGGIASGKSTVAKMLAERGCTVIDADELVAELHRPGEAGSAAVRDLFSAELLDATGATDREKLAALVFSDAEARRRLEAAIHPLVGMALQRRLQEAEGIVVFEAALLVETGGADRFDLLVTVEADPALRLERAVGRGVDRDSARARIAAQTDAATRMARADIVLRNDGGLAELSLRVDELLAVLRERERARAESA